MTTTTFVLNEAVIKDLGKVRRYAEDSANWSGLVNGRLKVTDFSHILSSGDVNACFTWVITEDYLLRHLSVRSKKWDSDPSVRVDTAIAFTLAHFLGFTGAKLAPSAMVVTPAKSWKSGTFVANGEFIVQQEVQKIGLA